MSNRAPAQVNYAQAAIKTVATRMVRIYVEMTPVQSTGMWLLMRISFVGFVTVEMLAIELRR